MADSEKQAEFALDLFSDIAPLLALFGDEFAKQFASESLTWVDHLISAMVPLGILTTTRGAIRVQGPRIVRSFIGRGRETRALAEIELMSSTSKEVCELFNGKSIIRAIGKPKIAQILVFPEEYDRLLKNYNKERPGSEAADEAEMDRSCGIHTLETAMATDPNLPKRSFEMKRGPYHSDSYIFMKKLVKGDRELSGSSNTMRSGLRNPNGAPDVEKAEGEIPQSNPSAPDSEKTSSLKLPGPPNLQLGLSSDQFETRCIKKGHEIFAAAVVAVILQVGLLAIATITVYGESTRSTLSFDPEKYGYPCYIGGSILLCIGVCLCSMAIERNTTESDWKISPYPYVKKAKRLDNISKYPRLLWLQKSQEVNDQSFGGYAILAGPKHHIITSSRFEDTEQPPNGDKSSVQGASSTSSKRAPTPTNQNADPIEERKTSSGGVTEDGFKWKNFLSRMKHLYSLTKQDDFKWKGYTVCGAVAAGVGFIAQLIGLRGLAYPCSIAHLLAVILMAFVRAMIRRRLGRVPIHGVAFSQYEIDYLATQLVQSKHFREHTGDLREGLDNMNKQEAERVLRWKVKTAKEHNNKLVPFAAMILKSTQEKVSPDVNTGSQQSDTPVAAQKTVKNPAGPSTSDATSVSGPLKTSQETQTSTTISGDGSSCQQLLRVRERLGDLCEWQSMALEAAKSLALSIEAFMDTFLEHYKGDILETNAENSIPSLDWVVETVGLHPLNSANQCNFVHIPIQKPTSGNKWQIKVGVIEAILSLWMATIESKTKAEKKRAKEKTSQANDASESSQGSLDWRYKKSGIDLRYKFCRVIGQDFEPFNKTTNTYDGGVLKRDLSWWVDDLIADQSDDCYDSENKDPSRLHSNARTDMNLIIGFNGSQDYLNKTNPQLGDSRTRELAISDVNALSTILAQHLFTSFMWTVVEKLPQDFLRQGSENSEQLVNIEGRRAFDPHDFPETWRCQTLRHQKLTKVVREIEKNGLGNYTDILLCMIPALSSKDMLPNHVMLKLIPPLQHNHGWAATARSYTTLLGTNIKTCPPEMLCFSVVVAVMDFLYLAYEPYDSFVQPQEELMSALRQLTEKLLSLKFESILKDMVPLYRIQQRWKRFQEIFTLCGNEKDWIRHEPLAEIEESAESPVGVFRDLNQESLFTKLGICHGLQEFHRPLERKARGSPKSMSWETIASFPWAELKKAGPPDIFGWSLLHYAALVDDYKFFWRISRFLAIEKLRIHQILDNVKRSPIHVAVAAGNTRAFEEMFAPLGDEDKDTALNASGLDHMTPLHLAAQSGSVDIINKILEKEKTSRQLLTHSDSWGRGAIHLAASHGHHKIAEILLDHDVDPYFIDTIGKAPLDYVLKGDAQFKTVRSNAESPMEIKEGVSPNDVNHSEDQKPVSDKIVDRKRKIFIALALKNPNHHDRAGQSFLHHAVQCTDTHTVQELLKKGYDLDKSDVQGRSALHLAVIADRQEMVQCLLNGIGGRVADPAATDNQKDTAFIVAARLGFIETVTLMCSKTEMTQKWKPFDPLARNLAGKTALHVAVEKCKNDVAEHLLNMSPLQGNSKDEEGMSLLLTACREGASSACVGAIAGHWPSDINCGDPKYDQTPLSWACEYRYHEIVEQLLKCADIDVNKPASKYENYTPLHVAVLAESVESINLLLNDARININAENETGLTASVLAVERRMLNSLRAYVFHHKIDCQVRLELLEQLRVHATSDINTVTLVEDALRGMIQEELGDEVILKLVEISENLRDTALWTEFVRRALDRETIKMEVKPGIMHVAARLNDLELMRSLCSKSSRDAVKSQSIDEDGWTCIEYAKTYRSEPLGKEIERLAQELTAAQDVHAMPICLEMEQVKTAVLHRECTRTGHSKCIGIHVIEVDMDVRIGEQDMPDWALLRTTKCVPPPSSRNIIYHEIKILEESAATE